MGDEHERGPHLAGVSTKTLYRLAPTKEALFKSVISQRIGRFILAIDLKAAERL